MKSSASFRLSEYLAKRGVSPAEFAKTVGANRSQIYRLVTGERGPSVGLAARIESQTGGAIRAAEWARSAGGRRNRGGSKVRHARSIACAGR